MNTWLANFLAIIFSFLTGLAIQRGGTCTVAAIQEILHKKTANRIKALIETSLWVLAGVIILSKIGISIPSVNNWEISIYTILGSILLGIGAFLNGACAIGSIARIGNREWTFWGMIPGFYFGAYLISFIYLPNLQLVGVAHKSIPAIGSLGLIFLSIIVLLRGLSLSRKGFHPYVLTIMIGILFLGLLSIDRSWSYTDLLIDIAMSKDSNTNFRLVLFAVLLLGSVVSGSFHRATTVERAIHSLEFARNFLQRFIGGAMMGAATLIIPGSHDSLILLYMPMLLGYAWLGFILMALTILIGKIIQRKLVSRSSY